MSAYDNLFQPLRVGHCEIPNRIVRTAHTTGFASDELIAYHEARAKGGVGLSTLEAASVHASSVTSIASWSDDCIPFYERLMKRIRPHGMKMLQQLNYFGASAGVWSSSAIPNIQLGIVPLEMTPDMIAEMVESYAMAARRCRDGGLDGVDIHASSGYLIHEFLSPAINRRTDSYGGSFENRLRFLVEVLTAVRAAVGDEFIVGVRLPNDDHVPGGLTPECNARIAQEVEPLVDYVSVHMGAYWRFHKLHAPADEPLGNEMSANSVIMSKVTKPRLVVGRIMTLDHASAIVRMGEADMVSMVRALIADPELVNKVRNNAEVRIRPCIGTNQGCVGLLVTRGKMSCVVNPMIEHEGDRTETPGQPASQAGKKILVVGGGPAGMETARLLAQRGHNVELHEAMKRLGGQVAIAADAPYRADLITIIKWLEDELDVLGVAVHLNSMVDIDMVQEGNFDEVVIATGSMPRYDGFQVSTPALPIPGYDLPHVIDAWSLFGVGTPPKLEGPAVIFDDTGTFEAISCADILLKAGLQVTLVSRLDGLGAALPFPPVVIGPARERLMSQQDFNFIGGHYIREISSDHVDIGVLFTERKCRLPARTVVLVGFNEPNRDLAAELEQSGIKAHLVGDVLGTRDIMTAIHGADELAGRL